MRASALFLLIRRDEDMYVYYICNRCGVEFVITAIHIEKNKDRYMTCPFGHKDISKGDKCGNIKECMTQDSFERRKGAIVQRRWGK